MRGPTPQPLDQTFAALAEPTRRAVVELLRHEPLRASDIAERLGASRPAMSRHLKVLRDAGLVAGEGVEDDARGRVYTLQRAPLAALEAWLAEVQAFWGEQLAAFAAHAHRKAHPGRGR